MQRCDAAPHGIRVLPSPRLSSATCMKPCKPALLAVSGVQKFAVVISWRQVCCSVTSCLPFRGKFAFVSQLLERRLLLLQVAILRGHPVYKIKRTEVVGGSHLNSKDDAQCVLHASTLHSGNTCSCLCHDSCWDLTVHQQSMPWQPTFWQAVQGVWPNNLHVWAAGSFPCLWRSAPA